MANTQTRPEKGHLAHWYEEFREDLLPPGAGPEQHHDIREAFYIGAMVAHGLLFGPDSPLCDSALSTTEQLERTTALKVQLDKEIERFSDASLAEHLEAALAVLREGLE